MEPEHLTQAGRKSGSHARPLLNTSNIPTTARFCLLYLISIFAINALGQAFICSQLDPCKNHTTVTYVHWAASGTVLFLQILLVCLSPPSSSSGHMTFGQNVFLLLFPSPHIFTLGSFFLTCHVAAEISLPPPRISLTKILNVNLPSLDTVTSQFGILYLFPIISSIRIKTA